MCVFRNQRNISCDMRFSTMWYVRPVKPLRSACAYAQYDQSLCLSLEYSMIVKLSTDSSESTLVKKPHCWKSHVMANIYVLNLLSWWRTNVSFCYCESLIELGVCHNFSEKHREELFALWTPANSVESDLRLYHVGPHDKRGHMIKSHRNHAIFNAITSPISVK